MLCMHEQPVQFGLSPAAYRCHWCLVCVPVLRAQASSKREPCKQQACRCRQPSGPSAAKVRRWKARSGGQQAAAALPGLARQASTGLDPYCPPERLAPMSSTLTAHSRRQPGRALSSRGAAMERERRWPAACGSTARAGQAEQHGPRPARAADEAAAALPVHLHRGALTVRRQVRQPHKRVRCRCAVRAPAWHGRQAC